MVKFELAIVEESEENDSASYPRSRRVAQLEVRLDAVIAWSLYRHAIEVLTTPEVMLTEIGRRE